MAISSRTTSNVSDAQVRLRKSANKKSWDNLRTIVFIVILGYIYVEPNPTSASWADGGAQAEVEGQLFQQLLWPGLFGLCCLAVGHNWAAVKKQFDGLVIIPFAWILVTSLLAVAPAVSLRRYIFMALIAASIMTIMAAFYDHKRIVATLMSVFALSTLYSYFYVFLRPQFGIHQATGAEPHLAGSWRGQFAHKNITAGVGALQILTDLCLYRSNRIYFIIFFSLQSIMLVKSQGKTAAFLVLPVFLLVAFVRAQSNVTIITIMVSVPLLVINVLAVGSLYSDELHVIMSKFLGNGSFTGRDELWRLLVYYSEINPITGSGFQSFWQVNNDSPAMVYGGSWTSGAFYGHQAYLDLIATIGVPGMIIVCLFLILRPALDLAKIRDRANPALSIYLGLWLFPLFQGVTESVLFQKADPSWVALLIGVTGIRILAMNEITERLRAN